MDTRDLPLLPNYYNDAKYKEITDNVVKCIVRGYMSKLRQLMKKVRLLENVKMQTAIFNIMLAVSVAKDQMDMFLRIIDQPEVNINTYLVDVDVLCIPTCMPLLCYAFCKRRNIYARLLLEHPSMLLLCDDHDVGALPLYYAITNLPLCSGCVFESSKEAAKTPVLMTDGTMGFAWSSEEVEERLRLIKLMVSMGVLIRSNTMTYIAKSLYKVRLLELTRHIWTRKSAKARKHCNNCLCIDKSLRKCSRCNLVYYCSISCQKSNYRRHKYHCILSKRALETKKNKASRRTARKCNKCGVQGVKLRRCGKCYSSYYCSTECCDADWNARKLTHCMFISMHTS